jgi:hypothetical protein
MLLLLRVRSPDCVVEAVEKVSKAYNIVIGFKGNNLTALRRAHGEIQRV